METRLVSGTVGEVHIPEGSLRGRRDRVSSDSFSLSKRNLDTDDDDELYSDVN